MIDPQVLHGGASSWFWIAANELAFLSSAFAGDGSAAVATATVTFGATASAAYNAIFQTTTAGSGIVLDQIAVTGETGRGRLRSLGFHALQQFLAFTQGPGIGVLDHLHRPAHLVQPLQS